MASLAEYEREIISKRTIAGLEAAKSRGSKLCRPKRLKPENVKQARQGGEEGKPKRHIVRLLKVAPATLV